MVEFPEQDQREFLFTQHFTATRKGLGHATLTPGSLKQVIRIAAVTGHAALLPQELQRQPASVIGQYHSQRRGAAFRCFHLQDSWHLHALFPGKELPDPFSFIHSVTGFSATG